MSVTTEDTFSISFSQDVYAYGDTMVINYASLPSNTQIYLRGTRPVSGNLETVYTQSYYRTGSGSISLAIPSQTATDYAVYAIYNNYTLATDYCKVAVSTAQVTFTGVVYDAETGARIEGALVMLDTIGPYTNHLGAYSMVRDKGTYSLIVSADGYQTYTVQSISLFSNTVRNIYLTPANFPGNLYGTITDYRTGERLENVLVTVKNSTTTRTTFTGSSGFYSFTNLVNASTYTMTATLDGYDPYANNSINMDQVTWVDIQLVPKGYMGPGSGPDDGTNGERPGRAAARKTLADLEETVPQLIMLVVFIVFLAVIKKGMK